MHTIVGSADHPWRAGGRADDAGGGAVEWGERLLWRFFWRGVSLYQCGRCMKVGDIFADKKL